MNESISIDELKRRLPNINLIDIRENYLFNLGSIPGAKNIPYRFLDKNPENYLNKNQTYYLLCEFGLKSKRLASELNKQGYHTINIIDGYSEYK